jgi:hypothetical protein
MVWTVGSAERSNCADLQGLTGGNIQTPKTMIKAIQLPKSDKPALEVGTSAVFSPVRLLVSAEVRYWEDAEINGVQDTEEGDNIPLKVGILWEPRIELETGRVIDWPQGTTADIHYKVCDQGEYWLEDAEGKRLKWKGYYVPNDLLAIGDNGYGDYIILKISAEGIIEGWSVPTLDADDWENDTALARATVRRD